MAEDPTKSKSLFDELAEVEVLKGNPVVFYRNYVKDGGKTPVGICFADVQEPTYVKILMNRLHVQGWLALMSADDPDPSPIAEACHHRLSFKHDALLPMEVSVFGLDPLRVRAMLADLEAWSEQDGNNKIEVLAQDE